MPPGQLRTIRGRVPPHGVTNGPQNGVDDLRERLELSGRFPAAMSFRGRAPVRGVTNGPRNDGDGRCATFGDLLGSSRKPRILVMSTRLGIARSLRMRSRIVATVATIRDSLGSEGSRGRRRRTTNRARQHWATWRRGGLRRRGRTPSGVTSWRVPTAARPASTPMRGRARRGRRRATPMPSRSSPLPTSGRCWPGSTRSAGCSIKDSFASLDLSAQGFRVLFEAEWIVHAGPSPTAEAAEPRGSRCTTRPGSSPGSGPGGATTTRRACSRSELLDDETIVVAGARRGDGFDAGAILHRSAAVVGVSNVFGDASAWAGCLAHRGVALPGHASRGLRARRRPGGRRGVTASSRPDRCASGSATTERPAEAHERVGTMPHGPQAVVRAHDPPAIAGGGPCRGAGRSRDHRPARPLLARPVPGAGPEAALARPHAELARRHLRTSWSVAGPESL